MASRTCQRWPQPTRINVLLSLHYMHGDAPHGQKRHMRKRAAAASPCCQKQQSRRWSSVWPSCGQKRHTRWPATNSSACNDSQMRQRIVCNEWRLPMHHRAVRKDTHAGLQRILRRAMIHGCGSVSYAMNYGCWYAIARSEKTHTLARNEFQVLMCHHAVRKDTHADVPPIPAGDVNSYRQRRANGC